MKTRDLVLVSSFSAIIATLGLLPKVELRFFPVPITIQSIGAMLAGCILGAQRGAMALALFILLIIIGLPVLPGGNGGLGVLIGPTGGFIIGWIAAAYSTGRISEWLVYRNQKKWQQIIGFLFASLMGGIIVLYPIGILWLILFYKISSINALESCLIFIPGDIVKAIITAFVGQIVLVNYPLIQPKRTK